MIGRVAAAVVAAGVLFGGGAGKKAEDKAAFEAERLNTPKILRYVSSKDSIRVYWSAVDGADGYKLYRKKPSGGWAELGAFGREERAFLRQGLKSGTKYTFCVRAFVRRGGKEICGEASEAYVTYTKENGRDAEMKYRQAAAEAGEDAVFGVKDLNEDGLPELIVKRMGEEYPCTLYSYYKGELYEPLSEFDSLYKYYPDSCVIADKTETENAVDYRYLYMPPHGHSVLLGVKTFYKKKHGGKKVYTFKKYYVTAAQFNTALERYTDGVKGKRFNGTLDPVWHRNTPENRKRFIYVD